MLHNNNENEGAIHAMQKQVCNVNWSVFIQSFDLDFFHTNSELRVAVTRYPVQPRKEYVARLLSELGSACRPLFGTYGKKQLPISSVLTIRSIAMRY